MGRFIRFLLWFVLLLLVSAAVYFFITYRDYSGIYGDKQQERDTTILAVVHHDAIDHVTSINDIEYQHKVINKWESGFAYTFYLEGGKIYQMHRIGDCSGHAFGYNCNSVSVCIHQPDKYEPRTRINLWILLWFLKIKYGLSSDEIVGHGELPNQNFTTCPEMDMDSLRNMFFDVKLEKIWEE